MLHITSFLSRPLSHGGRKRSRWISSDLAGWELINPGRDGFSFIESQNWYSYTSNNPVRFVDPTGMWNVEVKIGLGFAIKTNFGVNDDTFTFGVDAGVGLGGGLSLDLNEKEVNDESIGTQGRGTIEAGGDVLALEAQSKTEVTVNPDGSCKNTSEASASLTDPKTNITGEIKLNSDGNVTTSTKAKENFEGGLEGWGFVGVGMETTIPIRERKEE